MTNAEKLAEWAQILGRVEAAHYQVNYVKSLLCMSEECKAATKAELSVADLRDLAKQQIAKVKLEIRAGVAQATSEIKKEDLPW